MAMAKMCPCSSQHHELSHRKYILHCCEKLPGISIPHQEKNKDATKICSKIRFHVYRNVSRFTFPGILQYEERTICPMCSTDIISVTPGKVYTQKKLVLFETLISEFHEK